jgi:tetratricopeptide (TPR) repeat protein
MSELWNEFHRRVAEWRRAADADRLKLANWLYNASSTRETDPEQRFSMLTQGRDEARRLREPWWELFFEDQRLGTLTGDLEDYSRALPLAMELMVRFSGPEGQAHVSRLSVLTETLNTYSNIDPLGYREELERGFAHLDGQITRGPDGARFVLHHRWAEYLMYADRYDEAFELANRTLALADQSGSEETRTWHGAWTYFYLCRICYALGRMNELAAHARHLAELSETHTQLRRTQADGWIWFAVTRRAEGNEREASRSFRRGMRLLQGLETRDMICADPISRYYEVGGEWKAALGVRDRELAVITKRGMLHRCCQVQVERCRLLAQAGELTSEDLDKARLSAARLRIPGWHLEKLARINSIN